MTFTIPTPSLLTDKIEDVPDGTPCLVTHSQRFHCDDALAIGLLLCLPEYKNAAVVRTRDQEMIQKGTVVVDVGGVYDPERLRFDHHQKGFADYFDKDWRQVTKMSSAGMVYKHFGKEILKKAFGIDDAHLEVVWRKIYEYFIESVDAIDNGVDATPKGVETLYHIRSDLTSRVSRLNESWNTWTGDELCAKDFAKAIEIAMLELYDHVKYFRDVWLPARIIVMKGIESRFDLHPSGRVIELSTGCPYEDHLHTLEVELQIRAEDTDSNDISKGVLFVIYPNDSTKKSWRVKTVKKSSTSFENRLSLPENLRGLRNNELAALGHAGVNFVHLAGFLAGCSSREAALHLVDVTLKDAFK